MKVGIVGSRTFPNLEMVRAYVRTLSEGDTVVSGGADGVDATAAKEARECGLAVVEHFPDKSKVRDFVSATEAFYARNQLIVNDADKLVAFTEKNKGGTWDSIRRARSKGIPVEIRRP